MARSSSSWTERLPVVWLSRRWPAWALLPLSGLYVMLAALHRAPYRLGWRAPQVIDVPVVVVGNLIAGGAGKTPTVMAVVALLRRLGHVPGIVSRGHGRRGDDVLEVRRDTPVAASGDEPALLHRRTGAPLAVGRDRVAAARALRTAHPDVTVVVSDDGLQHLRLARDVQVIVFDDRGAGNGWPLPAGPLREAIPRSVPPRSLVLYNAARPTTPLAGYLARRRLAGVAPLAAWRQGAAPSAQALTALKDRPLVAAAGIAEPARFFAMLRDAGLRFEELPLPDHHDYAVPPWPRGTADVVLTEKDAVKLDPATIGPTQVWVAALDFAPDPAFDAALAALLPPAPDRSPDGNAPA